MKWSEIPREAKAYMLYHTLIGLGLIVWTLFSAMFTPSQSITA